VTVLAYAVAAWLFVVGLYGIITSRHLVHLVVCLSVVQSSTYVLLLAVGYRTGAGPPIFANVPPGTPAVDPVVQALTLTDIVVGATVTALLLALAVQVHKRRGTLDPRHVSPMQG
jgi:multicomponent Na+:H+ antiporter subunit C